MAKTITLREWREAKERLRDVKTYENAVELQRLSRVLLEETKEQLTVIDGGIE